MEAEVRLVGMYARRWVMKESDRNSLMAVSTSLTDARSESQTVLWSILMMAESGRRGQSSIRFSSVS